MENDVIVEEESEMETDETKKSFKPVVVKEESEMDTDEPKQSVKPKKEVYLPGKPLEKGEELVCDQSAYHMLHDLATGAPCLSFDIIPDALGENRETFPHTAYIVAGTQAERANGNNIIVMKLSNMHRTSKEKSDSDSDSDESDSDSEDDVSKLPRMEKILIKHHGCVNRIRCMPFNNSVLAAVWSEMGKVTVLDVKPQLESIELSIIPKAMKSKKWGVGEPIKPLYVFTGHQSEGFGVDWCSTEPGVLATGDCKKNIHIWKPTEGSWHVDQLPLIGHTASVEDLQWSPKERNVLASCSVDKSIRIWDTREPGAKACKLTVEKAHLSDINVISWNKKEPLIASGGDDGFLHIWDLRNFKTGESVATLKHHTDSVTTVEWHPTESSIFASGGADDQIALWDLALERDNSEETSNEIEDLPPQLLFIHQGQQDIKELHWHSQIPGCVISTANSGFNFFKTISV